MSAAAYYAHQARAQRAEDAYYGRSDKYSSEQLKLALSIAKSEKVGVDWRGRVNQ